MTATTSTTSASTASSTAPCGSRTTPGRDILRIDTGPAEAIPGVHAVFTAADVAGELRVGLIHKDWPVLIPEGGRTSYYGDVLAIVVADDRLAAREAAEAIEVEYRVLKPFTDPCRGGGLLRGRGVGSRRQRPLGLQVRQG